MGQSSSKTNSHLHQRGRHNNYHLHNTSHTSSTSSDDMFISPTPPVPQQYPLPPPFPPPTYHHPSNYYYSPQPLRPFSPSSSFQFHQAGQTGAARWPSYSPAPPPQSYPRYLPPQPTGSSSSPPAALPVEHEQAKQIKSDINVHKDTIRVDKDEKNPDQHLVSFTFDANFDGSITILYFAKEGNNCAFSSLYPELCKPVRIPFQKGSGQRFHQTSGSGIDLGFFELDDLSKPLQDVFPLVVCAEVSLPAEQIDKHLSQPPTHSQFTEAVIEKKDDGPFLVKVIKQILWIDGERYEVQDIFGLETSTDETVNEDDAGKDCVICLSETRNTVVFPCRHLCMCTECAKSLTLQSDKCPICRQPVEKLVEINVKSGEN